MKNNLFTISDEEYMEKMLNYEVIDGRIYSRSNNIVSKHLNKYRRPTTVRFNHRDHPRIREELGNGEDWLRFYDHVEDFRIKFRIIHLQKLSGVPLVHHIKILIHLENIQ